MKRYERNYSTISHEEQALLGQAKVCVIGCGGLGGYIIEMLARIGVGHLTVVDGDRFDETNLNRQLLASKATLGVTKVQVAAERVALINSEVQVMPIEMMVEENNAAAILKGHDLIVDALDHIGTRLMVSQVCRELGVPFVFGAIAGWYGMVATVMPGDRTLEAIYKKDMAHGAELELGNPSFTPGAIASFEVAEVIKLIIGRGEPIRNGFLHIDLLDNEYEIFKL